MDGFSNFLRQAEKGIIGFCCFIGLTACGDIVTQPKRSFGLGDLTMLTVSPNGQYLATAGQGGAFLWNFTNASVNHHFQDHGSLVSELAFSPDSQVLLTAGRDHVIRAWHTSNGQLLRTFEGHGMEITHLDFHPQGGSFLSSSIDSTVRIWNLASGEVTSTLVLTGLWVNTAVFSPDGTKVATAENAPSSVVRLWDVDSASSVQTFTGHVGQVWGLGFLPNGSLVTSGDDKSVRIWDPASGLQTGSFLGATQSVFDVRISDGNAFAVGSEGQVIAWNSTNGAVLHNVNIPGVFLCAPLKGTNVMIVGSSDLSVKAVQVGSGITLKKFEGHTSSSILKAAFSPDGKHIISGAVEKSVRIWNATNSTVAQIIEGKGSGTYVAAFSPDGSNILTAVSFPQPAAQLWNRATGSLEREFKGHASWLLSATFSHNGAMIATASADMKVKIWNTSSGTAIRTFSGHTGWVRTVAFAPDTTKVASGSDDGSARIWDLQTGQQIRSFPDLGSAVKAVTFSPSGETVLAATENGDLLFWEAATGELRQHLINPGGFLNAVAYSPDGKMVLSGEGWPFFVARLWDVKSGEVLRVFAASTSPIETVAFSPSGLSVVTGGDMVRLWSIGDLQSKLHISQGRNGLDLRWGGGLLQKASQAEGPWEDVPNATSPWQAPLEGTSGFFRVRLLEGL